MQGGERPRRVEASVGPSAVMRIVDLGGEGEGAWSGTCGDDEEVEVVEMHEDRLRCSSV